MAAAEISAVATEEISAVAAAGISAVATAEMSSVAEEDVFRCSKWVAMARYGLPMGGKESYGLQEAFGTPPRAQNGHKNSKSGKSGKSSCLGSRAGVIEYSGSTPPLR